MIGLSQDNRTLFLFSVDNAGGSRGMTLPEIADLLVDQYGVYNALNLDGGGSTTLAMEDPATQTGRIVNVSSDNPDGRSVGSNLAIFAIPGSGAWAFCACGGRAVYVVAGKESSKELNTQYPTTLEVQFAGCAYMAIGQMVHGSN